MKGLEAWLKWHLPSKHEALYHKERKKTKKERLAVDTLI
jgi:hypothetical protein